MQHAQTRALTLLSQAYREECTALYREEKEHLKKTTELTDRQINSRASSRARLKLSVRYWNKYRRYYKQAVSEGFSRSHT
jgi:hypothetical protein